MLTKSARRCCVCFGLNADKTIRSGQIAHVDGDNSNADEDNLAFLCLEHHNELDSKTSQSKGLTTLEVKHYRDELYNFIEKMRNPSVSASPLQGVWLTMGGYKSITIQEIGAGVFRAHGVAIDNPEKEAPNLGFFDVISRGFSRKLAIRDKGIWIDVSLEGGRLIVQDRSELGSFGIGVSFNGRYELSSEPIRTPEDEF